MAATIAGLANKNFLPGAAGLTEGYNTGRKQEQDRNAKSGMVPVTEYDPATDSVKIVGYQPRNSRNVEKKNPNNSLNAFLGLVSPETKTTQEIKTNVEQSNNLPGAPDASKLSDGHILKDSNGTPVAISKGGKWLPIQ